MFNAGADINIAENVEIISLYASELSEPHIKSTIKLLLQNGLKPETLLFSGVTPSELKKLGVKKNLDINVLNHKGETIFTNNIGSFSDDALPLFSPP